MILLRQKLYSKPNSEKSVNLGGTRVKYKDMTEKQLKNLASYKEQREEKRSTKEGRKDDRKRNIMGATGFAAIGGGFGAAKAKNSLVGAGVGMISGLATWELLKIAADASHKNHAKLAKEELKRRGIDDWKRVGTLKERNKEVLDDLRRK